MNRQTLLETIDRQLSDSFAESGSERAVGEIMQRLAEELNAQLQPPGSHPVFPIELIAAFVDGPLDPEEEAAVCDAAMVNSSVLAELVAAVRARQTASDDLPPLNEALTARLVAMRPRAAYAVERHNPPEDKPAGNQQLANEEISIRVVPFTKRTTWELPARRSQLRSPRMLTFAAGAIALAATIVGLVVLIGRGQTGPGQGRPQAIASSDTPRLTSPANDVPGDDVPGDDVQANENPADHAPSGNIARNTDLLNQASEGGDSHVSRVAPDPTAIVKNGPDVSYVASESDDSPDVATTTSERDDPAREAATAPDAIAASESRRSIDTIARNDASRESASVSASNSIIAEPATIDSRRDGLPSSRKPLSIRWTQVSGMLAQRNPRDWGSTGSNPNLAGQRPADSLSTDFLSIDSSSDSSTRPVLQREAPWKRIQQGVVSNMHAATARRVAVRTLPFSRAEGALEFGGKMVVSADTGLVVHQGEAGSSIELDLIHGSVALVGLQEGAVVAVKDNDRTVTTLRWLGRASTVIHRVATGFQFQVDGGKVEVNEQVVDDDSVRVAANGQIQTINNAPKRLPRWITRPYESSAVERRILAQISNTDDVSRSLNNSIRSLASSSRLSPDQMAALQKLARWRVSLEGPHLYRLVANRIPAVRFAAMQRLAQTSEFDPRFRPMWRQVDRAINNERKSRQFRKWFNLVHSGTRPNNNQIQQLLTGLSTRDLATRAISDFVLRRYTPNPPPYDPSWSGSTLQRAINVYRQRTGVRGGVSDDGAANRLAPAATVAPRQ